jgi:surfactin synthase thioesterase subunit
VRAKLRRWHASDSPHALICLGHAGAGASHFRRWPPTRTEEFGSVYAVQLPGREDRLAETPLRTVDGIVDHILEGWPGFVGKVVLFGHSLGAVVSYELALRLERQGQRIGMVIASGHRAPHLPRRRDPIHALPRAQLIAALARFGGTPRELLGNAALLDVVLPVIRADFEASETYQRLSPKPLRSSLVAIAAEHDPIVAIEEVTAWSDCTVGLFASVVIPGHHFAIFAQPDLAALVGLTDEQPPAL